MLTETRLPWKKLVTPSWQPKSLTFIHGLLNMRWRSTFRTARATLAYVLYLVRLTCSVSSKRWWCRHWCVQVVCAVLYSTVVLCSVSQKGHTNPTRTKTLSDSRLKNAGTVYTTVCTLYTVYIVLYTMPYRTVSGIS